MTLDVYTLFVCELYVTLFLVIIMFFAWRGAQYDRTLGYLCLALCLTLSGLWLSSLRANGALFFPVVAGNMLILMAYGILLNAFRAFRGAACGYGWLLGMTLWAVLCLFPAFYHSLPKRVLVSALLCVIYTALMIRELYRTRTILPVTWWPAQLLLWVHIVFNLMRILMDAGVASSQYGAIGGSTFSVWVIIESILLVIGLNFTFLAMVNERNQLQYKQASLLDPLTGVWNRRALFQQAEKCRQQCERSRQPLSVLLFDLDHFKSINDRFGHTQGDRTLINFCQIAQGHMPLEGWFARLGGEEFAAVMIVEKAQALVIAELIRSETAQAQPDGVDYTVSIGVASDGGGSLNVGNLMTEADDALYRAKARGRNCVVDAREIHQNPPTLATGLSA